MNGQKLLKDGTLVVPVDVVDLMDVDRVMLEQKGTKFCSFFYRDEIIRCKDCKHWETTWTNDFAPNYHYCPLVDGTRRDDFYCADAERRGEEE